jgi:hypothetical protein
VRAAGSITVRQRRIRPESASRTDARRNLRRVEPAVCEVGARGIGVARREREPDQPLAMAIEVR